jgi:hypothetical protein
VPGKAQLLTSAEEPEAEADERVADPSRGETAWIWNSTSPVSSHFQTS